MNGELKPGSIFFGREQDLQNKYECFCSDADYWSKEQYDYDCCHALAVIGEFEKDVFEFTFWFFFWLLKIKIRKGRRNQTDEADYNENE